MMRDLYNALPLPDDRPILSLCLIEDLAQCPPNYTVVSKTHDQDIDADLHKDGFFQKNTRYLCHSKTEGYMNYVIESIKVTSSKEFRPPGYTLIESTFDTCQKAFKKKQLCFKVVPINRATQTITDIIILSRSKLAPEGFTLVGEMNGLCICVKGGSPTRPQTTPSPGPSTSPHLPYAIAPNGSRGSIPGLYPPLDGQRPSRQAPLPPGSGPGTPRSVHGPPLPPRNPLPPHSSPLHGAGHETNTLYGPAQSALSGVPFVLNKKYSGNSKEDEIPKIKLKSKQQIEDEFYYSFSLEHDQLQRPDT